MPGVANFPFKESDGKSRVLKDFQLFLNRPFVHSDSAEPKLSIVSDARAVNPFKESDGKSQGF
jgi:hypothetical protein